MQESTRSLALRVAPMALAWLATRAAVVALYATTEWVASGDVHYYDQSLAGLGQTGIDHTLPEYPLPAVALLWIPYGLTHLLGLSGDYVWACAGLVLALDGLFTAILIARRISMVGQPADQRASWWSPGEFIWILAIPAIGATALARFDIVPGIFVALALLFTIHHPRFAGTAAAIATAVKYWPAIIIPTLLSPSTTRRRLLIGGAVTGALLTLACVIWAGPHRLLTPLNYQHTRGLQIESIAATPAMLAWGFAQGEPWRVFYASSKSFEITGPLTATLEQLSTAATILGVAGLIWLWWRAWRNLRRMDHGRALAGEDPRIPTQLAWLTVTSILMFIVTSKVFSPQYLLWLLPSAAVGCVILTAPEQRRRFLKWSALLLVTTLITQCIFPLNYGPLMYPLPGSRLMTLVLALRNLSIVVLTVVAARQAFLATRHDPAPAPRHHHEPEPTIPQMGSTAA